MIQRSVSKFNMRRSVVLAEGTLRVCVRRGGFDKGRTHPALYNVLLIAGHTCRYTNRIHMDQSNKLVFSIQLFRDHTCTVFLHCN